MIANRVRPSQARTHPPAATEEARLAAALTSLRGTLERQGSGAADLTSASLLVVDNDGEARGRLAAILSGAGYDVRHAASAREARHALEHETIAVLLSEVSLPGETGLDLMRFVVSEHPHIATLLISALEDPGIAQAAIDVGAAAYLSKPVGRSAVLVGVMSALRRRNTSSDTLEPVEHAVEDAQLLQAETFHRWALMAEFHDLGIGGHVKRMSRYCAVLGSRFGMRAESLELAAVLHDVGKIAVPDRILLKPRPLTADERLATESHAQFGYEMLRGSGSPLLDLAAVIALTHHEKFDGSGYPQRLSGPDIPLAGRIAAAADVFDALTSDRAYRRGWSVKAAVAWMKRERGSHFDPCVVDVLASSLDEILSVRSEEAPPRRASASTPPRLPTSEPP